MNFWYAAIIALGASGVGLMVFATVAEQRRWNRERREAVESGETVVGWLVQANSMLFKPGLDASLPAQLLISFAGPRQASVEQLATLADQAAELKSTRPANTSEKQVAAIVRNESPRTFIRELLPDEFTDGLEVYAVTVHMERKRLPGRCITERHFFCKALPGPKGAVFLIEYPESAAA